MRFFVVFPFLKKSDSSAGRGMNKTVQHTYVCVCVCIGRESREFGGAIWTFLYTFHVGTLQSKKEIIKTQCKFVAISKYVGDMVDYCLNPWRNECKSHKGRTCVSLCLMGLMQSWTHSWGTLKIY